MRKLLFLPALVFALAFAGSLHAQELDLGLGFGTVVAPAASVNSSGIFFPSLSGGLYTSVSGTVRLHHFPIGFNGQVAWRTRQAVYLGVQPYRPIFYDFNANVGRTWHKKMGADIMAGIGAESLRFYTPYFRCGSFSCTNYQSINHFMFHVGGDFRYYIWHTVFIRPEAHYYIVHDNAEFNNVNPTRFAIAIGYSFLPGM